MVLPSGMAIRVINEDTTSTNTAASTTSGSEENKGSQHRKRKSTGAKAAGASQPIPKVSYEVLSRPHQMGPLPPLPNHQALPCHPFKMPHPIPLPQVPPIPTSGSYQQWTSQVRSAHISCQKRSHDYHPPNLICSSKECLLLWWSDHQACTTCIPEADR